MKIFLNKNFYNIDIIEEAIEDFKEVCEGTIINDSIEIELTVKEDVDNLEKEFCNYVLGLMKNKNLV